MATSQQFVTENGDDDHKLQVEQEAVPEEAPVEEPPFQRIYLTDKKIKYMNNKYVKLNAKMYDSTCDVKLKLGDTYFKGHRKVLSDASDYFDAMFKHQMKEKDEFVIEIKELSPAGISAMLDYFYHGHVSIEQNTVPNILEAGRFFHVDWILDVCCDYMIRHLGTLDFYLTMELADRYALGDLRFDIFRYFSQNIVTLVETPTFYKDLCYDFLFSYLMESLHVDVSEFTLMQLALKWSEEGDMECRKEQLLPLLRLLRFPIMDLEELEEIPCKVTDFKELKDEIEDAKMYCLNIPAQCLKADEKYMSRGARPTVMMSMFCEDNNVVVYKDPYDDNANLFIEQLGPSGLFVDYNTMNQVVQGNFLFAAGGYNEDCISSRCTFRYDPRDRCWIQLADMNQPRVSFSLCSSKNKLYAVGGVFHVLDAVGEEVILASVEMYDPEDNSWKPLPDLPTGCFDMASVVCRDKLYVTGGISGDASLPVPLKQTLSLNEGKEWSSLPDMLFPRQGHSMSVIKDKIYVLGGYTSQEIGGGFTNCYNCEVFDVETSQWTEIAPSPEDIGHLYRHVGVCDSRIYFLCTEDSEVYLANYDTEKDEYSEPVNVGPGLCKVSVLSVGYPYQ